MACPVGRSIHAVLDDKLLRVQEAMERELTNMTLADVVRDIKRCDNHNTPLNSR